MSLKTRIQENLKEALKEKREAEISTLRMLLAALSNKETEKRTKIWKEKPDLLIEELEKESQLTNEEIIEVISSEIKKNSENYTQLLTLVLQDPLYNYDKVQMNNILNSFIKEKRQKRVVVDNYSRHRCYFQPRHIYHWLWDKIFNCCMQHRFHH